MARSEIDQWIESSIARLRLKAERVNAELAAFELVAEARKRDPRSGERENSLGIEHRELIGLSISDAAYLVASRNGGVLLSTRARELMQRAGVLSATRASSAALYAALNADDRFERGAQRGEYRIVRHQETAGSSPTQETTSDEHEREPVPISGRLPALG